MIEYLATCLIKDKNIQHAIRKYEPYCILQERVSLIAPTAYGFSEDDTFGFGDDEYGFWGEYIYK